MAEVVVEHAGEAAPSNGGLFGEVHGVFGFIGKYWWVFLIILFLIFIVVAACYLVWYLNKKKLREDEMYLLYERTVDACRINSQRGWISKAYRWWWIPVIGTPVAAIFGLCYLYIFLGEHWWVFWTWVVFAYLCVLPLVFVLYKDKSMKIINAEQQVVGYYRGHVKRMDGFIYLWTKVGKKWVFLDDKIILKLPENVRTLKTVMHTDEATGAKSSKAEFDYIEIEAYSFNIRNNYIFIPMVAMVAEDSYFYVPTLIDEKGKILDLRQKIQDSYHLQSGIQHVETLYSNLSRVTNQAVDSSVIMSAVKKTPQKQRDVDTDGNDANTQ